MPKSRQILHIPINTAAAGNLTLVAANPLQRVLVMGFGLIAGNTTDVAFRTTTGSQLTGPMHLTAVGPFIVAPTVTEPMYHYFAAGQGHGLVLNNSAAVQVGGWVVVVLEL